MACGAGTSLESTSGPNSKKAKRQVSVTTVQRWQTNFDKEHQTLMWLRFKKEKHDKSQVSLLFCEVCKQYESHLKAWKGYSSTWVDGSTNYRSSNILDHAASDQHKRAMSRLRIDQAKASSDPVTSYSPIVRSLMLMSDDGKVKMKRKFDITYVMAKQGIAFSKYPALYELEARHGVDLGFAYQTKDSARSFTQYIAKSQRQQFCSSLSESCFFFSLLMDGTTDTANLEDELIVIVYCRKNDAMKRITSCARYLAVINPPRVDAQGLVECLRVALKSLGIEDTPNPVNASKKPVLVGVGTDGASANISGKKGMRGILQEEMPWLFWAWCFAHRLELAAKDALKSRLFKDIGEMLLRIYYIYEKSPKKSRELSTIADDLKEVYELPKGGNVPIRAQGSRWITHKRKAMQRIVDRFGIYISHLTALSEDRTLRSEDRDRLAGFVKKWCSARILIGCAAYIEVH
jgi:hypothetical protein